MKTLKHQFKSLIFLLVIAVSLVGCSKDDDTGNNDNNDNDEDLKGGHATAVIGVDNKTIQFSTETDNSFAAIVKTKLGENDIKQLIIVMMDDNSDAMIITQAAPAPDKPINYDVSNVGLNSDYFFTSSVAVEGKNSSDDKIYGVGIYQQGEEVVNQSKGSFKITSLSKTNIKGTFEMTLYNSYDPKDAQDAEELTVTEGEFDLPIVELDEEDLGDLGLE